jgi:hypothetical protein
MLNAYTAWMGRFLGYDHRATAAPCTHDISSRIHQPTVSVQQSSRDPLQAEQSNACLLAGPVGRSHAGNVTGHGNMTNWTRPEPPSRAPRIGEVPRESDVRTSAQAGPDTTVTAPDTAAGADILFPVMMPHSAMRWLSTDSLTRGRRKRNPWPCHSPRPSAFASATGRKTSCSSRAPSASLGERASGHRRPPPARPGHRRPHRRGDRPQTAGAGAPGSTGGFAGRQRTTTQQAQGWHRRHKARRDSWPPRAPGGAESPGPAARQRCETPSAR